MNEDLPQSSFDAIARQRARGRSLQNVAVEVERPFMARTDEVLLRSVPLENAMQMGTDSGETHQGSVVGPDYEHRLASVPNQDGIAPTERIIGTGS
jgi:hypothetical protein